MLDYVTDDEGTASIPAELQGLLVLHVRPVGLGRRESSGRACPLEPARAAMSCMSPILGAHATVKRGRSSEVQKLRHDGAVEDLLRRRADFAQITKDLDESGCGFGGRREGAAT